MVFGSPENAQLTASGSPSRGQNTVRLLYALGLLILLEGGARGLLATESFSQGAALRSEAGWRLRWLEGWAPEASASAERRAFHPTLGWTAEATIAAATPRQATPRQATPRQATPRQATPRQATPRQATPRQAIPTGEAPRRILVLGAAFATGSTYSELLSAALPGTETRAIGVAGHGHDQQLLMLREQAPSYRPDLVILGFTDDDMTRNMLAFRDFAKPRFILSNGRLSLRNVPVPSPEEIRRRHDKRPRLIDLLSILRDNYQWQVGLARRRMIALTTALLDEMVEESVRAGAVLAFVYLPNDEELKRADLETEGHELFTNYCDERAAFCIDLLAQLRDGTSTVPAVEPPEIRRAAHRIAARALGEYFRERDILQL